MTQHQVSAAVAKLTNVRDSASTLGRIRRLLKDAGLNQEQQEKSTSRLIEAVRNARQARSEQ